MAGSLASINIKFFADLKQFSSEMQNANRQLQKHGKQMQSVGKGFTTYLTAPLAALTAVSLISYDKQAKAIAQVEAGIKSTGAAAGFTSQQLQTMASDLQNKTIFGDEEILQGATAQLLTFTNIAGEQFARTQVAVLDLATRLDGDLKSASIQLGKALNDPVANLSALSRAGIQFSKEQKTTINALVATNRLADAQTLILDELQKQYGGSAEAAAKAGTGGLKQLSNIMGDLMEDFGKIISEFIAPFIVKIKGLVLAFKDLPEASKKTIAGIAGIAAVIGPLLVMLGFMMTTVIPGLIAAYGYLTAAVGWTSAAFTKLTMAMAMNPWTALAGLIAVAVTAFVLFNKKTDETIKQQSVLGEVTDTAAKSIASERAKLTELLSVARNEHISKQRRLQAIEELNKISPKYLGNLTLETINTNTAKTAVELYNKELLRSAGIKAAQDKLTEISAKQIDNELQKAKAQEAIDDLILKNSKQIAGHTIIEAGAKAEINRLTNLTNSAYDVQAAKLTAQEKILTDIIGKNILLNNVVASGGTGTGTGKERKQVTNISSTIAVGDMSQTLSPIKSALSELEDFSGKAINTISSGFLKIPENLAIANQGIQTQLEGSKVLFTEFQSAVSEIITQTAFSFYEGFGALIGNIANGTAGMKDVMALMLGTVGDMLINLGKLAISTGIAIKGIVTALKTMNPFVAIAAGVAAIALGTFIKGKVSNLGKTSSNSFAEGGIVGGSSYYGDKIMSFLNSGEGVFNNNQMKTIHNGLQGGNNVQYVPYILRSEVQGNHLKFVLKQQDKLDLRTK